MNEKLSLACMRRLKRERDEARRELAVIIKDRDKWERKALLLEAKRVEGLAPPYKFTGEGTA